MLRRTVIQEPHAEFQKSPAQNLHVIGPAQSSTIDDPTIVAGERVTPFRQPAELHMRLVDHSLDPVGARQPEASRKAPLDHRSPGRPGSRHVDNGRVGCGRRATGRDAPLVYKGNVGAAFDCRDRRPASSRAAANDKNVSREVETAGFGASGHLAGSR